MSNRKFLWTRNSKNCQKNIRSIFNLENEKNPQKNHEKEESILASKQETVKGAIILNIVKFVWNQKNFMDMQVTSCVKKQHENLMLIMTKRFQDTQK